MIRKQSKRNTVVLKAINKNQSYKSAFAWNNCKKIVSSLEIEWMKQYNCK